MLTLVADVEVYDLAMDRERDICELCSSLWVSRKAISWTRVENDMEGGLLGEQGTSGYRTRKQDFVSSGNV
jgi:hypothetical protein